MTDVSDIPDMNYGEEFIEEKTPTAEDLKHVADYVDKAQDLELVIHELKNKTKRKEAELRNILEVRIVDIMDEVGMASFTTSNGYEINIKPSIRISITNANRPDIVKWLKEKNHGGMVKDHVTISFGPHQQKEIEEFLKLPILEDLDSKRTADINTNSIKAFLKKMVEEDSNFPLSVFNASKHREAKIKSPKRSKK